MTQQRVTASVAARSTRVFALVPVASKETVSPEEIKNGTMRNLASWPFPPLVHLENGARAEATL
jgi:hypothetical protein